MHNLLMTGLLSGGITISHIYTVAGIIISTVLMNNERKKTIINPTTYSRGIVYSSFGKKVGTYRHGTVFNRFGKTIATYGHGFIKNLESKIIAKYNDGHVLNP